MLCKKVVIPHSMRYLLPDESFGDAVSGHGMTIFQIMKD
ncbi:hypothetical protein BH23BAC3_BH23BAC3_33580 [soil metagenome]